MKLLQSSAIIQLRKWLYAVYNVKNTTTSPPPLICMLFGCHGSGKTIAIRTFQKLLQNEMQFIWIDEDNLSYAINIAESSSSSSRQCIFVIDDVDSYCNGELTSVLLQRFYNARVPVILSCSDAYATSFGKLLISKKNVIGYSSIAFGKYNLHVISQYISLTCRIPLQQAESIVSETRDDIRSAILTAQNTLSSIHSQVWTQLHPFEQARHILGGTLPPLTSSINNKFVNLIVERGYIGAMKQDSLLTISRVSDLLSFTSLRTMMSEIHHYLVCYGINSILQTRKIERYLPKDVLMLPKVTKNKKLDYKIVQKFTSRPTSNVLSIKKQSLPIVNIQKKKRVRNQKLPVKRRRYKRQLTLDAFSSSKFLWS